jgi:hypothetical protein
MPEVAMATDNEIRRTWRFLPKKVFYSFSHSTLVVAANLQSKLLDHLRFHKIIIQTR